ncbi:MAG: carbohydrate kinase family protein [Candidatus Limnocylindria bacterium]
MTSRVLVLGDALLDVYAAPRDPVRAAADVPADIRIGPGGQGANIAVRLARRGVDVTLACSLADDVAGRMLRQALEAEGVDLVTVPTSATGMVVIVTDHLGERTMMSQRIRFASEAAAMPALEAEWLVISGYLLLEPGVDTLARSVAAQPGRRVLVGCAVADDSVAAWRSAAFTMRPDMLVLNDHEAERLDLGRGPTVRVVTHASGARACVGELDIGVEALPGPPAIDTTGAGDAFTAALLDALLAAPWPPSAATLEAALTGAVALGGAVARTRGAQAPVPGEGSAPP